MSVGVVCYVCIKAEWKVSISQWPQLDRLLKGNRTTMTRQVMGNKVFFVLTVCFLFMAAQHLDAVIKQEFIYYPSIRLTWEKARLHCQKNNIDLISFKTLNRMVPSWFLKNPEILKTLPLWVGLVRHSEDATLWNEVSFKWVTCYKLCFIKCNLLIIIAIKKWNC